MPNHEALFFEGIRIQFNKKQLSQLGQLIINQQEIQETQLTMNHK